MLVIALLQHKYSLMYLWRQTLTVESLLTLKQVVQERLERLNVQARLPSRGQFLVQFVAN